MPEEQTPIIEPTEPPVPEEPRPEVLTPEELPVVKGNAPQSRLGRFKHWFSSHKKLSIPISVIVLLLVLAAIPVTRYGLAGLIMKQNLQVQVYDSTANTPVSGADVSIGAASAETSADGTATLYGVKVGNHDLAVSKKYYQTETQNVLVPILKSGTTSAVKLTATGRQVKVVVTNLINGTKLAGVDIETAGISAKTDSSGNATIVLPAGTTTQAATLSLNGFDKTDATIQVSNDKIQENDFTLTPSGKVYFLSKLSGAIDVISTNLDGSDRQTVLAGTGSEDDNNTVLLASPDWKYLALVSQRAGDAPTLYMIDTADNSLQTVEHGNKDYSLTGWLNGQLVYTVTNDDLDQWSAGYQQLKSYNPATQKLTVLDQTKGHGSTVDDYVANEITGEYIMNGQIYYTMDWTAGYNNSSVGTKDNQATFNSVSVDGTGKKTIKSFALASDATLGYESLTGEQVNPAKLELDFFDGDTDNFYVFANGQVTADNAQTVKGFYGAAANDYLLSPDGTQTFWSEERDGKNTLFTGDQNGQNAKQIATLSKYDPYGWYNSQYLLVSKDSTLYVMPADGSQPPVKISDYQG